MNKERLLKLAEHLESSRGHKFFNFNVVWETRNCGTCGCAVGELPFCFPDTFNKEETVKASFRGSVPCLEFFEKARLFFEITDDESNHLFEPEEQLPEEYGGCSLDRHATAKQVAQNIRDFCNYQ